jgi:hypothetical protein
MASMPARIDLPPAQQKPDLAELSIAGVAGLSLALIVLYIFAAPIAGNLAASRDFVSYWATGRLLINHGNPYDRDAIAAIEHSAGLDARAVLIMRNPPWALPLAYPLGFLGLRVAGVLWTLLLLSCLLLSLHMLHQLYGSPANRIHWLGFAFTPALICFTMGQTPLLALLGFVLFLRLYRRRPFAAGASLWLCALKPHLFLPFALVLLIWIFVSRSYRVFAGVAAVMAADALVTVGVDPAAWSQYAYYMRASDITREFTPCLGDLLRDSIRPSAEWLAFVPAMLGSVWALAYFWPRRRTWNWLENGNPVMLVSLLVAPFGWIFDQSLAIPALLGGAYATRSRNLLVVLVLAILLLDFEISKVYVGSPLYLWTAPAWLVWYLFARAARDRNPKPFPALPS